MKLACSTLGVGLMKAQPQPSPDDLGAGVCNELLSLFNSCLQS